MRQGLYMGFNSSVQRFVEMLNDLNCYLLYFPGENLKQLDQDEIIEILDQAKAPEWHEAMVNANIDFWDDLWRIISYFKCLQNLENIRRTNGPNPSFLPVDNRKFVTSIVDKSSENHKRSNIWCHYCDKNNHNTADCRAIAMLKQQKKACFDANAGPRKKSMALVFEEINAIKRKLLLKPEKTASSKKSTKKGWIAPLFSLRELMNDLTTSSDEGEEYLFISSEPFSTKKTNLAKPSHPSTIHWIDSEQHYQQSGKNICSER
jgi:hypothetical protein